MVEEFIETSQTAQSRASFHGLGGFSHPTRLSEIKSDSEERIPVPIGEFSRVLGLAIVYIPTVSRSGSWL
jgi:hypothetical protein